MSDGDPRQTLLEARAARYRLDAAPVDASRATDMVVFERAGARYGVPIAALSGIHRLDSFTPLPGMTRAVKGLANVQGQLVAVHDLGSFAKPPRPPGAEIWLLVCQGSSSPLALLADDVDGVRSVAVDQLGAPPISLDAVRDCFAGFGEDGVGFLDLAHLLEHDEFFKA